MVMPLSPNHSIVMLEFLKRLSAFNKSEARLKAAFRCTACSVKAFRIPTSVPPNTHLILILSLGPIFSSTSLRTSEFDNYAYATFVSMLPLG